MTLSCDCRGGVSHPLDRDGFVFSPEPRRPNHKRLEAGHVGKVISEIGKQSGVVVDPHGGKTASAHDLRRSFGSRWAPRVMPSDLMVMMRHQSISTTMAFYVSTDADSMARRLRSAVDASQVTTLASDENGTQKTA